MYSAIPVGAHEKKTHQFFSQKQSSSAQATAQTLSAQSPSAPPTSKESPATASTLFVCFTNRCGSTLLTSKLSQFGLAGRAEKFKNYEHFNHKVISTYCNEKKINSLFDYSRSTTARNTQNNKSFVRGRVAFVNNLTDFFRHHQYAPKQTCVKN